MKLTLRIVLIVRRAVGKRRYLRTAAIADRDNGRGRLGAPAVLFSLLDRARIVVTMQALPSLIRQPRLALPSLIWQAGLAQALQ